MRLRQDAPAIDVLPIREGDIGVDLIRVHDGGADGVVLLGQFRMLVENVFLPTAPSR